MSERPRIGRRLAALEDVVDQVLLQLRRRQFGGDGHQHQAAHDARPSRGSGHSIWPSRPRIALRGMHRGHDFARRRQPLAALRAVRDFGGGVGVDFDFAGGAQVFEVAGDAVEPSASAFG